MAKWWAAAVPLRSGGNDRLPAVRPGSSATCLEMLRERGREVHARHGWELAGAWETLMVDESECFVLWAVPTWESWAEHEKARRTDSALESWRADAREVVTSTSRILLIDSPLCPFRIGRQPRRSDRTEPWDE